MFSHEQREEIIIEKAKNGNELAIEYLINHNMDIVYAKAKYFFIKGLDKDDVIQEGMLGLFKAIRDYQEEREASFRGFSQLCVHRQLISAIKRANRQKHQPLNNSTSINKTYDYDNESGRSFSEILPDKKKKLEDQFVYKEIINLVFAEIEKELTQLEKKVFYEYLEDRSYKEISEKLDINIKTVDNALQRARKKIEDIKSDNNLEDLVI
ncbi:MAG: sigma-70 family RNA polymerase sigma factor [Halanaerobiales bacterium]|nr:sigma-70 family RNA polymerase sigma factor [Halanaerobiales bacterium]